MALEISPVDSFNQIKEINKMLNRRSPVKKKEPEKRIFTQNDEIDLRAFILENTSSTELTRTTNLIDLCKDKGYHEPEIVNIIHKMMAEKLLDSLNDRFLLRLDDSD